MPRETVGKYFIFFLLIMSVGLLNHVTIVPALLASSGRDAWMAVLLALAGYIPWIGLFVYVSRRTPGHSIVDWTRAHYGPFVASLVSVPLLLYLASVIFVTLYDLVYWASISFLQTTPPMALAVLFMGVCYLLAFCGIRTIVTVNLALLPLVIVLGFFVATMNVPNKDYRLLFPLLERGLAPVAAGSVYSAAGLGEVALLLLLLKQHLRTEIGYGLAVLLGVLLAGLTIGPLVGAIVEFGLPTAASQRFPAYDEWGLVSLGHFLEHLDYFSIYQWMTGAFIRVSLALFIALHLYPIRRTLYRQMYLGSIAAAVLGALLLPFRDDRFIQFLSELYLPAAVTFLAALPFAALLLVRWKLRKTGVSG